MKKIISEKAILLFIGIGIWALVLQNTGIIPSDKGVYINGGNVSVSGNVNVANTVDVNIKEVGDSSVTGGIYKFGNAKPNTKEMSKEFFDWFDANPPAKDCKKLIYPNKDEEKCVKYFFDKNILKNKEVQTNIVNV